MEIVLCICCCICIIKIIWDYIERKQMKMMLNMITEQLDNKKNEQEKYIRIKTTNPEIQQLINSINIFLEKQYEQAVEYRKRSQQAMQMMTNISHDIKTPLTVLGGYTEMLQNRAEKGDDMNKLNELIAKMKEKTDRSIKSINQLFDMIKIESGDYVVELQNQDIVSICEETILEYYDLLEESEYEVQINLPEKPIMVLIDKKATSRILKNLVDNAIKYGKDGKYFGISINSIANSDFIEVRIEDHGKGISKDECNDIFRRSYRVEKNDKNVRGSGLGLAISQNLAVMMQGSITVESIQGEKTVFCWKIKS